MKQGLLSWSPCRQILSLPIDLTIPSKTHFREVTRRFGSISATLKPVIEQPLTARDRRQLRNEKRESSPTTNWREELDDRLGEKNPKKKPVSWREAVNLDNLARLGPRWWIVKISRASWQATAELLARRLAKNFPQVDFKVYAPAVQVKRSLKNGSYSVKPKPLFPGYLYLKCVLNKELHDFIRECQGVYGFMGFKVGNIKKEILRPKPVSDFDMESVFRRAKEDQEKAEQALKEEKQGEGTLNPEIPNAVYPDPQLASKDVTESGMDSKPKRRSRKSGLPPAADQSERRDDKLLRVGSAVRVTSGTFAEFAGILKKRDRKTRRATVGFTLFGKETLVDLDVDEIVADTKQ